MFVLVIGVVLFCSLHRVVVEPQLKQRVKAVVGNRAYGPLFGILSLISLLIIILGWHLSDFVPMYEPKRWGWHVNYSLTLLAFICLGIFLLRGSWRQKLRFPLAIGTMLWAVGHLCANGDLAGIILFGGLFSGMAGLVALGVKNKVQPSPVVKPWHNLWSVLLGVALYGIMTQLHYPLIGVPITLP